MSRSGLAVYAAINAGGLGKDGRALVAPASRLAKDWVRPLLAFGFKPLISKAEFDAGLRRNASMISKAGLVTRIQSALDTQVKGDPQVEAKIYHPRAADVVVIDPLRGCADPLCECQDVHLAMRSDSVWISYFMQKNYSYPGYPNENYDQGEPDFTIYRYDFTG